MGVIKQAGYTLPSGDQPLTHARIAHSNNWISGTATASSTASDRFVDAPNDPLTYYFWGPSSLPGTWTLTPTAAQTVDYCCIAAHTMGTNGNALTVEYEQSPGVWVALISNVSIEDDMPVFAIFEPVSGTAFRVTVSGGTVPRLGVIKFGRALQMPQQLYGGHKPLDLSRQTTMRSTKSTTGEFLGRTRLRNALSTNISWQHIKAQWIRDNWKTFQFAMEQDPFFLAWRPETFSEVGYCYVEGGELPAPTNMGVLDFMEVSMDIIGHGYE